MTVAPGNNQQGNAELGISTAGVATTRQVAKMRDAANSVNLDWPDIYVEASSFKVRITITDTLGHQAAQWILAIVEDSFDPSGNYTDAAGTALSTGVLAVRELGDPAAGTFDIVMGDGSGTNGATLNAALAKFGTFRLVLAAGNNVLNAKRVSSATAAGAFHEDSDGNTASGAGDLVAVNGARIVGTGGVKCKLTAASRTAGNWGYGTGTITASFTLKSAIDGTSAPYTNAALKNVKAAWDTVVAGTSPVKKQNLALSTLGVVSVPATNIDTDWGQVVGGSDYYTELAVGQNFGDATTPAGEKAAIYAIGTTDAPDNEQMAYVFANVAQVSPFVNSSDPNRRLRTNTADQKASAAIQPFKDSGHALAGVAPFSSSGRTVAQDIFKRTGQVNTTNAIPFLRVFLADAYGVALPNAKSIILETRTAVAAGDNVQNTQTLTTGSGTGVIDWSYTIAATAPAFNRFVKAGTTRVANGHVATGPDNPASPPATFSVGNGAYIGPFPAYPRDVRAVGNAFAGVKEPSVRTTSVFGVNSEIIFEDCWTGALTSVALDANGVPTGPGNRNFVIPNSAKCKLSTLINEGSVRVIVQSEFNPKDIAGRSIDLAGAEKLQGRRSLWNQATAVADDPGTNLSTNNDLDTPLGYGVGNNSLDTVAAPSDPGSFTYYQGFKDLTLGNEAVEDAAGFLLTTDASDVGFQTDQGNFGYFAQSIAWVNPDLSLSLALTPKVAQSDPGLTQRFGLKVFRTTPDAYSNPVQASFASIHPDENPVYVVWGLEADGTQTFLLSGSALPVPRPGASGAATGGSTTTLIDTAKDFLALGVLVGDLIVTTGSPGGGQRLEVSAISTTTNPNDTLVFGAASAVGAGTGYIVSKNGDHYFDLVIPGGYFAVKVNSFARVSGSPVPGGSEAIIQIGYTFDAVAFATGLPFK